MAEQERQDRDELLAAIEATRAHTPPTFREVVVNIGPPYLEFSAGLVPETYARDAVEHPDGIALYEHSDMQVVMATRVRTGPRGPYLLLIIGDLDGGTLAIRCAFRLDPDEDERATLAADPSRAFAWFLERFGGDFMSRGRRVRFLPAVVISGQPRNMGEYTQMLGEAIAPLKPDRGESAIVAFHSKAESGRVLVAWPFIVIEDVYTEEVRRRRGGG